MGNEKIYNVEEKDICPICKSNNLSNDEKIYTKYFGRIYNNRIYYKCVCNKCGAKLEEHYKITFVPKYNDFTPNETKLKKLNGDDIHFSLITKLTQNGKSMFDITYHGTILSEKEYEKQIQSTNFEDYIFFYIYFDKNKKMYNTENGDCLIEMLILISRKNLENENEIHNLSKEDEEVIKQKVLESIEGMTK